MRPRHRFQLGTLLVLMITSSLAQMVSVAAIFPFLSALGNTQQFLQEPRLRPLLGVLHIDTAQRLVLALAIGFIATQVLGNGLALLVLHVRYKLAGRVAAAISSQAYYASLHQSFSFYSRQHSSALIQTLIGDTDQVCFGLLMPGFELISNAILTPFLIFTLVLISWQIAIGSALILGISYFLIFRSRQQLLKLNGQLMTNSNQAKVQVIQESIGGIRELLLDHSQPFFHQLYNERENTLRYAFATNMIIANSPTPIIETIVLSSIAILALTLGRGGDFSQVVPVLGSLSLGAKRLLPALQSVFGNLSNIQGAQASLSRVLLTLDRSIDPLMQQPLPPPVGVDRELRLSEVWFRYDEGGDWVLRGLDLTIAAKTTVAFVGSTGSGKSTTADLILGLLSPQRGQVLVDGVPLQGQRLMQWQAAIAHVPQQIYLRDGSLASNIAFGLPEEEIDFVQVRKAAKLAQIHEFIEGLPAGYETYVGEQGVRLSGGQRQRIGIARALYKNASIIVFDEATSALDNATEREVMAAIEGLGGQFTIILIAHRLSTVERCDLVIELDQGRVVGQGRYDELLATSRSFQRMSGMASPDGP
ncbi:MAG: ABC transporter ATP-binding protein [Cyanobacteriota bacterium]|nr:ABC transporter ATP-binding protein [Cyanobacteriota bacterium]